MKQTRIKTQKKQFLRQPNPPSGWHHREENCNQWDSCCGTSTRRSMVLWTWSRGRSAWGMTPLRCTVPGVLGSRRGGHLRSGNIKGVVCCIIIFIIKSSCYYYYHYCNQYLYHSVYHNHISFSVIIINIYHYIYHFPNYNNTYHDNHYYTIITIIATAEKLIKQYHV